MANSEDYNMKSHDPLYHRRWVDLYLFRINQQLIKDPLWNGRFYVHRMSSRMSWFEDHSGGFLVLSFRITDRETYKYKTIFTDALEMQSNMFMWINDFIVNDLKVWENEKPYDYYGHKNRYVRIADRLENF